MIKSLPLPALLLTLAACSGGAPSVKPVSAPAPTGMVSSDADGTGASVQQGRPALTTELLPSLSRNGTLKAESALLQRPVTASVILRTLQPGQTVQILGNLDNADGQWLSVAVGDTQGWVRASAIAAP